MPRTQDVPAGRQESRHPAPWHEPAPGHFDVRVAWWVKALVIALLAVLAVQFLDRPVAVYTRDNPIADYARRTPPPEGRPDPNRHGDIAREIMFLEQWGQGACTVLVICAVALLDRTGRRRALSIALACIATVILTHLLKDLCGRSRPFNPEVTMSAQGLWQWGGPARGFSGGSRWGSFPSAHTTAAFALAASLAWFYPRGRALFMGLACITGALRVLHTAHYVSDVIAGMGIGVMTARWTLRAKLAGRLIAMLPPGVRRWWLADG